MRIVIATTGSDGDLLPFFALAQRLIARGHDVRLASSDRYARRAAELCVPFAAVGPRWDDREAERLRATFERVLAEPKPLAQLALILESLVDDQRASAPGLDALARDADLVVYPPIFVAAVAAARKRDRKHVSVHFAPMHRAEAYGPTGASFGRIGNAMMWRMASSLLRKSDPTLNRILEASGMGPWKDILLKASHSKLLDLVAVSPRVIAKDRSWGPETQVTGYWFADDAVYAPPPELARFVEAERPVVIGFGSMMGMDARSLTATISEAVKGLGRRVVVQAGWAGLGEGALPENVHVAGFVSHAWLFERAACVVHHGGAGTTAAAFRAGVPQAIFWHLGDQPVWGKKAHALGVGPKPRAHRKLDARTLREGIERMLGDATMNAAAAELGAAIRTEDGTGEAVQAIEAIG